MSAIKLARVQELEVALAVKNKEIEDLQKRLTDFADAKRKSIGLVEELMHDKNLLLSIPIGHVGNVVSHIKAARDREGKTKGLLEKQCNELEMTIQSHDNQHIHLKESIDFFNELTAGLSQPEKREELQLALEKTKHRSEIMEKELRLGTTIKARKEKTINTLTSTLEKKESYTEQALALQNDIRVIDRDVREKKRDMKELLEQHQEVDGQIKLLKDHQDHGPKAILDRDNVVLTKMMDDAVEKRRLQDRIIKAEEYRINQMRHRIDLVDSAIERNGITKDLQARVIEIQKELLTSQALSLSVPEGDELYEMDKIVPPHEDVHPAIFSLFATDRENREKHLFQLRLMADEKRDALDAILDNIASLQKEYEDSQDQLYNTQVRTEKEVEDAKIEAKKDMDVQKEIYLDLLSKKAELRSQIDAELKKIASQDK